MSIFEDDLFQLKLLVPNFNELLIVKSHFNQFIDTLNMDDKEEDNQNYIPRLCRKYLLTFFSSIAMNEHNRRVLCEIFGKSVSELRYIKKEYCHIAAFYLEFWKEPIMNASYQLRNEFVYMNGEVVPYVLTQLRKLMYVYAVHNVVNDEGKIVIRGSANVDVFTEDIRKLNASLLDITHYVESHVSDD